MIEECLPDRIAAGRPVTLSWHLTRCRELLDRTLVWNQRHPLHVLRQCEIFYNEHRPHQRVANARPLAPLPEPITDPDRLACLTIPT